jgi:hypothetical protein
VINKTENKIFMGNYKYFVHGTENLLATQSDFTKNLKHVTEKNIEYFEVQIEIAGVMQSKLRKFNPDEWV